MALFNPLGLRSALNDTALTPYTPDYQRTSEQMDVDSASQLERGWESSGLGETANGLKSKALAAYRSGDDLLGASLEQQANDMSARAAQWAPTVQNFTDINGVGSAVDWAGGALGGLRTSVAPALGGLAGTVGGAAIGLGLRNPGLGARVGGYLGSALAGGKSEYDEAVANAMDDPTIRNTRSYDDINNAALVKGGVNSLLEAAVPGKLSGDLVLGAGKHLAKKAALKTAAKEIGEAALTEGATEGVQSLVGQAAQNSLLGNDLTDFDYKQALNEGAAGAMGGIGMGAAGATNTMARSAMAGAPKDEAAGDKPKFNITDAIPDAGGKLGELAGDVHGKVQDKLDDAALKKISDDFERLNKIKGGSTAVEDFDKGIPKEVLDGPDADLVKYDNDSVEQMASTILNGDKREYTDAQRSAAAAYFADKNTSAFRASMKAAGKEKVRQEAIDELRDILPKHSKQMIDSAQPTSVTDEGAVVTKLAELWRKNEGKKFDPIFDESDNARVIASGLMEWVRSGYGAAHNDGEPMMPTKLIKALGDGAHKAIASMTDYLSKQGQLSKDVLAQRNDVEKEIKRLSMSDSNDMGVLQNNLRPITSTNWSAGKLNNLVSMLRDTKGEVSDKTKKVLGEDFNNIDDIIAHFSDPSRYTKQVASEVKGMGGKSKATLATQVTDSDNIGLEESAHDGEGEFYDATPTTTNGVSYHGAGGAKAKDLKPFDMNRPDGPAKMQAVKDAQKNNMGAVVEVVGARDHAVDTAENVRDAEDAVLEKFGPSLKDDGVLGDLVKNWASGHMTVDDLSNKQRDTLLNLINGQFKYVRVEQADSGVDHRHIAPKDVANYRVEYKDKASGYANRNKDEETADKGFLYLERTQGGKTTEFPTRASRFMTAGEFAKANADQSDHTVAGERNRGALGKYNQLLNGLSNLIVSDGTFTGRVGYRPTPGAEIVWLKDVDTAAREVENFKLRDDSAQERMSSGKNMVAAAPLPSNLKLSKTETIADARARALEELYAEEKGDVGESRLTPRDFTPPFLTSATEKKSYVEGLISKIEDQMAAAVKSAGDNKFMRQQALAKAQWRAASSLDLVVFDEEGQLVDPSVTLAQIVESGAPAINRYYQSQRAASAMMTEAWDTDYGDVGNIGGGHIGLSPTMQKALNRLEKWRAERSAEYKKNPSEDLALRLSAIEHMIGLIELKREFTSTKDMRENQDKVFEARRRKQSDGVIEEESDESGSIRSEDGRRVGNSEEDGYTAGGKAGSTSARGGRIEGARYAEAVDFERMRAAVAANPDARKRVGARIEKLAYRDFRGINSAAFVPMKATDEAKIKAMKPATERMMPRATDAVAKGNKLDTGAQPTKAAGRDVNQLTPKEAAALKRVETAQQWVVDILSRNVDGLLNAIGKMNKDQVSILDRAIFGVEGNPRLSVYEKDDGRWGTGAVKKVGEVDNHSKIVRAGLKQLSATKLNELFFDGNRSTIHQAKQFHATITSHSAEIKAKIKAREHEVKNGQATGRSDQAGMDSGADSSAGEGSVHRADGGVERVVGEDGAAQGRLGQRDGASGNLAESDGVARVEEEGGTRGEASGVQNGDRAASGQESSTQGAGKTSRYEEGDFNVGKDFKRQKFAKYIPSGEAKAARTSTKRDPNEPVAPKLSNPLTLIKKLGGISPSEALDLTGEKAVVANRKRPGIFKTGGLSADGIREALHDAGWISDSIEEARALIDSIYRGEEVVHPNEISGLKDWEEELKAYHEELRANGLDLEDGPKYSKMSADIHNDLGKSGFSATHDSPIRHEGRFDWRAHQGKGEGNASFGAGTYLSTADGVHRSYKNQFTAIVSHGRFIEEISRDEDVRYYLHDLASVVMSEKMTPEEARDYVIESLREQMREYSEGSWEKEVWADAYFRALENTVASDYKAEGGVSPTYHVSVNIEQDRLLDWNAPISEQSAIVREAIANSDVFAKAVADMPRRTGLQAKLADRMRNLSKVNGNQAYDLIARKLGSQAKASDYLQSLGVLGHKYSAAGGTNDTHPNYVIYDDSKIETNFVHFSKKTKGEGVSTPEQRKAAEDYITRTLGDSVKTAFEDLGGFSGKWTPGHTKNTISLAINGDVLGAAFHESIHELFKMLKDAGSEKTRELLERVAMNPILNREIERMLDGHPEAQAQVRKSPEEAVAFMYQMYASGQLKLGPQTRGLFDMIKDFLMKVAGLVSDGIRAQNREAARKQNDAITAQHVLDAFFSGGAAKDGAVTAVSREAFAKALEQHVSQHEAANKNIGKSFDDLARKAGRVVFSAEAMMDLTGNKHVIGLARQFNQKAGEAMTVSHSDNVGEVRGSFFDGVRHETDKYMNRLRHLMEGYDPKDMEMARKFMSTRKDNDLVPPTDRVVREIVRKMDAFFSEMGKYMAESDIRRLEHNDGATPQWVEVQMRKNYWPRVFDTDYLMKNGDKFVAALMTHHKAELEAIVKKANAEVKKEASAGNNSASGKALAEGKVDVTLGDVAQAILARMLNGGTIDLAETETSLGMTPAASAVNQRELTFLNMEHFDEFVSKDTVNIMSTYARNMVKRGEYQKRFGYGGEKIATAMDKAYLFEVGGDELVKQAEDALPDALADWNKQAAAWHKSNPGEPFTVPRPTLRSIGIGQHANVVGAKKAGEQFTEAAKKLDPASKAVQAFEGTLGNDISPNLRAMNSWMVTYQNFRLLSTMLFTSFQDVNGVVINGGDMKDAWNTFVSGIKAIKQSVSKNNPPDAQMKRAEEWGTVDAGSSLDALGQAYGSVWMTGKAKKLSDAFFKWTGAEGWNRGIRSYATQVAERTVMDWVQNGVDMKDPAAKARFERLYGKGATVADIKLDAFGGLDVLDQRNRAAINRWVLDAIPAPNASHRPIWGSDPRFQSFIHLKNYTYTWHRTILQSAIKSASMGDFRPGLVAALGYMPIAIAAGAIKEMLTPGEDPPWMQGGLDDYLSYGFARAGVLGVPQMYAGDLIEGDIARIIGPGWDQAQDLLSVPIFDDKYLGKELAGALPGGNLLKRAVPQGW